MPAGNALTIPKGGTGQTTAAGARKALGLEIGVDVQPHSINLDALAALPDVNDLVAIEGLAGTGIAVRTAANTWTTRTLAAPAAGFTITNPAGIAGNPTFVLANDLAALEGLAANGMIVRTATDTMAVRTITGTAAEITVSQGDGVAGNPTVSIPTSVTFTGKTITGGTYNNTLYTGTFTPSSNDGVALGSGALSFSDLFLAAGGVANWNNGALTLTESSGSLTFSSTTAIPTYTFQGNDAGAFGPFLQLYHNSASPAASDAIAEIVTQGNSSTGVKRNYGTIASIILDTTNTSEDAQWQFYNMQAGTLTSQMQLDSATGLNVQVGGIKFPASAIAFADANTLDDYEEGTWTPVVIGLATAGTGTYTTQTGQYIKVGRIVWVACQLAWTAHTGTGNLQVNGLPFTASDACAIPGIADNLTFANQFSAGLINAGTSILPITESTGAAIANIAMDTVAGLRYTGCYRATG